MAEIPTLTTDIRGFLTTVFPEPVVAQRAPRPSDDGYAVGQVWINDTDNTAYILTSYSSGSAEWQDITGGSGSFTSLSVSGNITSTGGNIAATVGSMSAGTTVTAGTGITSTTGDIVATAGSLSAGTTVTAGTGLTVTTGDATISAGGLAISTATQGITLPGGIKIISRATSPDGVVTAPIGSLCLVSSGTTVSDRMWINTDSGTTWTAVVTEA